MEEDEDIEVPAPVDTSVLNVPDPAEESGPEEGEVCWKKPDLTCWDPSVDLGLRSGKRRGLADKGANKPTEYFTLVAPELVGELEERRVQERAKLEARGFKAYEGGLQQTGLSNSRKRWLEEKWQQLQAEEVGEQEAEKKQEVEERKKVVTTPLSVLLQQVAKK